jgi:hypothetical protein
MGVNIFILDRRPAQLAIGGTTHAVGSLRRSWKITEVDGARADEMSASEALAARMPSPKVAMLADVSEMPVDSSSGISVRAHLVIGWDEGRTRVTDMGWDYLPVLGYAVRDPDSATFVLYEERDQALHRMDQARAIELGLIGVDGQLLSQGQPVIMKCRSVHPFIAGYAEADCTFDNGRKERLLIGVADGVLPEPEWLHGKTPMQAAQFPPPQRMTCPSPAANSPSR